MAVTHDQAKSVFLAAIDRPTGPARDAFLVAACGPDADLRREVDELLAHHGRVGEFLEAAALTPADDPGATLGRYKLIEPIGAGGMGAVWLAEQQEPVRRPVALKVIKAGMDTRSVLARFEAERQALALMDHPNIARVLDAGATAGGRPYFVMELVKGVPITRYCDEHRLTPRERLELFVPVCQAVQHAHQKGVIHRDLKPSNVLVAEYDGRPAPKVIDFGVAKAAGQPLTEETLVTGFGTIVGTPEYMSPEQAELNQPDVDTRSDIYSLGVLLYELVAGSPPFTRAELEQAGLLAMLSVIREREPATPSFRLSTSDVLPTLAANRGTEPARLTKLVRGELDWIVLKALEKDRNRRYETAAAFAADVQRFLADEPVLAGPPSTVYRLRKFLRRNRGRVAAAVALAASILVGGGAVLAVQARANRDRAADRAAREAGTTAGVAAAVREARVRAAEAWDLADDPDRMRQATDSARAAVGRAEDAAASGLPTAAALAELDAARRDVDDVARHARLIVAADRNRDQLGKELSYRTFTTNKVYLDFCDRQAACLREFGLDPVNQPADEVAHAVAVSRVRDALLGILLEWHGQSRSAQYARPDGPAVRDRIGRAVRDARQLCGGAYARWQTLLDGNDVPGLVAFAASPDGLSFRAPLVGALAGDLSRVKQHAAGRAFLRSAVERNPHDVWLHAQLAAACRQMQPPDNAEALRHSAAASALRPDGARFHSDVGDYYLALGANESAVVACRRAIALDPDGMYWAYLVMGSALEKLKDLDGAAAAYREANHRFPDLEPPRALLGLVSTLTAAGRHAEVLAELLATFRRHPGWANQTGMGLRYLAARAATLCADGKGVGPPPLAERPACRKQAHDLLTGELAAVRRVAAQNPASAYRRAWEWLQDGHMATVREPAALAALPAEERAAWTRLWSDVRDLRDRTAPVGDSRPDK
jgi:tetratricopeptide (TPR) repeat protein